MSRKVWRPPAPRPSGFTLAEMMVAVALVGVLAALAGSALERAAANSRVSAAARNLRDELSGLRIRAIAQGVPWGVCLRGADYAEEDALPGQMTFFAKRVPLEVTAAVAAVDEDNDRIVDERVLSPGDGTLLQFGDGVEATGTTTVIFDARGRPFVFNGDSCTDAGMSLAAGWPDDPVEIQVRIPGRAASGRWVRLTSDGTLRIRREGDE